MAGLSFALGGYVGGSSAVTNPTVTNEDARGFLVSLMPPGKFYDFENPNSDIYGLFYAFGQSIKLFGYDVADRLHVEFNPANALEKLPDWENALNLLPGTGNASAGKSTTARRLAIVGKLRESGASTVSNIQAAVAPVLGYTNPSQLVVYETYRQTLTTAHTYTDAVGAFSIAAGASASRLFTVMDDGTPTGGIQVFTNVTGVAYSSLTITLTSPTSAAFPTPVSYTWANGTNPVGADAIFYALKQFQGAAMPGVWTLTVQNNAGVSATWNSASLFAEGLGPSGLGGDIFYWGIYVDPALTNAPDLVAARAAMSRLNPAHAAFFLITSLAPWPDVTSGPNASIPDTALPV